MNTTEKKINKINNNKNCDINNLKKKITQKRIYSDLSKKIIKNIINNTLQSVTKKIKKKIIKNHIILEKNNRYFLKSSFTNVNKNNLKNMIEIIPQLIDKNDIEFIKNNNEFDKEILDEYEIIDVDTKIKFYGI